MADLSLKSLLRAKSADGAPIAAIIGALEGPLSIEDTLGNTLLGAKATNGPRIPILHGGSALGCVTGPRASAEALGALLAHIAAKEAERRALAGEVLHLYREVHLIDQLSEELTAILDVSAASQSALAQARRLIPASSGGVLVRNKASDPLQYAARFGEDAELLESDSPFITEVLERGVGEIVNPAEIVGAFASDGGAVAEPSQLRSLIFTPLRAKQRIVGLIVLSNNTGDPYTAANLKLLNTIALQTAAAIENSLLCTEMVESARYREQLTAIQRELETARSIQHSLVPRSFPPFPDRTDFDLHAQMTSARHVGGDFFDFFLIDNDHLGLVIGDVSGKGTASALFMAVTHTHVRTVALRCVEPVECMAEVNRILMKDKASSMYATCFYAILNTRTGELRYSSAGHNPPYCIRSGGAILPLDPVGGLPLGLLRGEYKGGSLHLDPGEGLFLYTDGVPEANNSVLDDFTDERLIEVLGESAALPTLGIIEAVTSRLLAFTAGAPQSDDITMVAMRRAAN